MFVRANENELQQVFFNLIVNAKDAMEKGGKLFVKVTAEQDVARAQITDTGPGIPSAEREKVFRRFYRLEASRTTPGSGLGLALVKAVAELHGATVELLDNDPGLRINVRFPPRGDSGKAPSVAHRAPVEGGAVLRQETTPG